MTPNPARGEVTAELAGAPRRLCLTLGALAELEGAFASTDLAARLARPSAADLMTVLAALLRGGGEHAAAEALPRSAVTPAEAARAVAAALEAAAS